MIFRATSYVPPADEWSFPAPSIVTLNVHHFAAHSTLNGIVALPPKGEIVAVISQPCAHLTSVFEHSNVTLSPSHAVTFVVPTLPHLGHTTCKGNQVSSISLS